jgi:hypothetical protein
MMIIRCSNPKARQRPRVIDIKSGAKAAGTALWNGWKDGITGIVTQPRAGYQRHGPLGAAAGSLIATVNIAMKPTVGTLSSVTWLGRGTYASVAKAVETYRNEGRRISTKLFDTASLTTCNGESSVDDDEEISSATKNAAAVSGFHPKICQHILQEFEKIKIEREQEQEPASSSKKKRSITGFFANSNATLQALLPNRRPSS